MTTPTPREVFQNKRDRWTQRVANLQVQLAELAERRDLLQDQIASIQSQLDRLRQGLAVLDTFIREEDEGT
jgi:chromosome segregation ATPase